MRFTINRPADGIRHRHREFKNETKEQLPVTVPSKERGSKIDYAVAVDYALVWSRSLACCSVLMLFAEGVNFVTGPMIALISSIGIFGKAQIPASKIFRKDRKLQLRIFISPVLLLLLHFFLITVVLLTKSSARMAGINVNEMALKLVFTSSAEEKRVAFGDFMDYQMIAKFILKETLRTVIYSLSIGVISFMASRSVARKHMCINGVIAIPLKYALLGSLLFVLGKMSILHFNSFASHHGKYLPSFVAPPPVSMVRKPSIIILSIDSLRNDLFSPETFPLTYKTLLGEENASSNPFAACTRWSHHDSGAFQSEQGFAALFYSVSGPQQRHFFQHKHDKSIKSWPLETLRSQGYYMHRIMSYNYKFCWVISADCDIHFRDFDTTIPTFEGSVGGGDARVYNDATEWIQSRAANKSSPYLLSIDLQDGRFPYRAPGNLNNTFLPELSEEETYLLKQNLPEMAPPKIEQAREKLFNRIKNSLRKIDLALSSFVNNTIISLLSSEEDFIFIITGDHGEILMDDKSIEFGHAIESANDAQRLVPMFMCGTRDIIASLRVPENVTTSHAAVLPSILRASGAVLGREWEREVIATQAQAPVVSRHPWTDLAVISSQSSRTVIRDSRVIESVGQWDRSPLLVELRNKLQFRDDRFNSISWPGLNHWDDAAQPPGGGGGDLDKEETDIFDLQKNPHPVNFGIYNSDPTLERLEALRPSIDLTRKHLHYQTANEVVDVVSIGSDTRFEYLKAQASTWASHPHVRSFWGFTEKHGHNETCDSMTEDEVKSHVDACTGGLNGFRKSVQEFISEGYTAVEDKKRSEAGWLCAQRRVGRALGWLKGVAYADKEIVLPDYLLIVDDDTYIDLDVFEEKIRRFQGNSDGSAQVFASCLFRENGYIKWPFAFGGFGTFLSKASIQQLIRPIYCKNVDETDKDVCESVRLGRIGERQLFREGMSIAELFHNYSSLKMFCLHSDWLIGYIVKYYIFTDIKGLAHWPSTCGNVTMECRFGMEACHRQLPEEMESFSYSMNIRDRASNHMNSSLFPLTSN